MRLSEPEALRLAQRGDAAGFELLYRLHSPRVYALCLRMVGNTAEAEDLTQEAFLQSVRKIQTFRGKSGLSTWLHRLTVNLVRMRLRKKKVVSTSLEETTAVHEESCGPRNGIDGHDLQMAGSPIRIELAVPE